MPSPFPGMDPYLEGSIWMSVCTQLSAEIARQLVPRLRPKYLALTNERFVLEEPEAIAVMSPTLYPDVGVAEAALGSSGQGNGGVITAPLEVTTVIPSPVPHITVEIRDAVNRRLVTAIEVLSPTDKRGEGREEYLVKRRRILVSTAHLMEIDLLHRGQRVPVLEPLPSVPYFVFLSRAERRPRVQVWPIALNEPLPVVPVPLLAGDADVLLDLQLALTNVYDLCGYDLAVDYHQPPEVTLAPIEAAWVEERLRARLESP